MKKALYFSHDPGSVLSPLTDYTHLMQIKKASLNRLAIKHLVLLTGIPESIGKKAISLSQPIFRLHKTLTTQ